MDFNFTFNQLPSAQKRLMYLFTRKPLLDQKALFSDETINFCKPIATDEGKGIKVTLRTGKNNVDIVKVCLGFNKTDAVKVRSDERFDYFEADVLLEKQTIRYHFEIVSGNLLCYYNKKGVTREPDGFFDFKYIQDFDTPEWAKGAVMYQVFVDRFYNGDKSNDVVDNEYSYVGKLAKQVKEWDKNPDADGIREFYGGDLQGIIDKIDYLSELGVEVIYMNPIFVSPSNHKYDTQDYDYIDPHYGKIVKDGGRALKEGEGNEHATRYIKRVTSKENLEASNALFAEVVDLAHSKGMKVILDGVFNHCGSFNKWLDKEKFYEKSGNYPAGAYTNKLSPYSNFFSFYNKEAWPDNPHYDGWWGYDTLPKLNYQGSQELYNYVLEVAKKWVSPPYNADGWRLDVAADLGYTEDFNHKFWRDFRKAVKTANPEALILAEHYGDPSAWLEGDQWDSVMNYDAFMEPVTWFLTGMEKHSDEYRGDLQGNSGAFFDAMMYNMAKFQNNSLLVAMNELSNHDHSRFLTRTNNRVGRIHTVGFEAASHNINKGVLKEAVVIQMTWPGAPTVYYGDEVGVCGWTDPDNRRSFPWGKEDQDLLDFHKAIIKIHKDYKALKTGSLKFLKGYRNVISYGRFDEENQFVVIINNGSDERNIMLPVWELGIIGDTKVVELLSTNIYSYSKEAVEREVINGQLNITVKGYSAVILKNVE